MNNQYHRLIKEAYITWLGDKTLLFSTPSTLNAGQASLMIISVLILFGFFGGGLNILASGASSYYGQITSFLSLTSLLMIPGVVISLWPTRSWVKEKLQRLTD